jgi:hypothetical protein
MRAAQKERSIFSYLCKKREEAYEAAVPEVVTGTSPNLLNYFCGEGGLT